MYLQTTTLKIWTLWHILCSYLPSVKTASQQINHARSLEVQSHQSSMDEVCCRTNSVIFGIDPIDSVLYFIWYDSIRFDSIRFDLIRFDSIRFQNVLVSMQSSGNLDCFPRGKRAATVRRYPDLLFSPVCSVFVYPQSVRPTLLREMDMGSLTWAYIWVRIVAYTRRG